MDKATALEVTRYMTELLRKEGTNVEQTILFGSCAMDEAHEDSDVDMLHALCLREYVSRAPILGLIPSSTSISFKASNAAVPIPN